MKHYGKYESSIENEKSENRIESKCLLFEFKVALHSESLRDSFSNNTFMKFIFMLKFQF